MKLLDNKKTLAIAILVAAILFLFVGAVRSFKVYDQRNSDFGIQPYQQVSERQLVVDATFTGTERRGDKLYSTYDRSAPVGKKACPT